MEQAHDPRSQAPASRRRLFMLGALLIPVLFFVLLEGALRLAGYGSDYPLFVEVPGYPAYRTANPAVGRRYFVQASLVPSPMSDAFLKEKPDGTYRIFVQGESSAAGFPYGHGGSFSRMLHQRLVQTFPQRHIEVVNTSMDAVSSYTLLDFADEIVAERPDAVLLYAGHNEYYGALGVGSNESVGPTRTLVRLYLALDGLRIVQGLRALWARLLAPNPADGDRGVGATLMEDMARERAIPYGSALQQRGLDQYRANLTDLVCRYEQAGIQVFLGTLASNERDQAPFVNGLSAEADARAWQQQYDAAAALVRGGDATAALGALDGLIRRDTIAALPYYTRGRMLDEAGRFEPARADYRAARDRDQLPFRAPSAMNETIRAVAQTCGATVVDTEGALARASRGGIIGNELMLEHLHPNVDGYFRIADAFYESLRASGAMGTMPAAVPADRARREVLVTELDSVLASLHVRRLKNNWPFQPAGTTVRDTFRVATRVDELAVEVLLGRRTWLQGTALLGALQESQGRMQEALRTALALVQEQPYAARPYLLAGNLFMKMDSPAGAFQYYQAAEDREPSAEARRALGHLLIGARRPADAVPWLERALQLTPTDTLALYDLGIAYAASGRRNEARVTAERLLGLAPAHKGARRLLARLSGAGVAPSAPAGAR